MVQGDVASLMDMGNDAKMGENMAFC